MRSGGAEPGFHLDLQGLAELRRQAAGGVEDRATLYKVARQFESLFTQQLLQAQRAASFGDPLFDSQAMGYYRDLHDRQLALQMAQSGGIGLADLIVSQLSADSGGGGRQLEDYRGAAVERAPRAAAAPPPALSWAAPAQFVSALRPHAERAAAALGIGADLILAQAALETGWGAQVPGDARGTSFNLFGIKAGADWEGDSLWRRTLEHDGVDFRQTRAAFRRYGSLAEAVDDYTVLLGSARYRGALAAGEDSAAVARELARAGYATDPDYAQKIQRVLASERLR